MDEGAVRDEDGWVGGEEGKGEDRAVLGTEVTEKGFDVQEALAEEEEVGNNLDDSWAWREVGGGGGGLVGFGDGCYEFESYDDEDK